MMADDGNGCDDPPPSPNRQRVLVGSPDVLFARRDELVRTITREQRIDFLRRTSRRRAADTDELHIV